MIKNQVYRVTAEEMQEIKKNLVKDETMFIVELEGKEMRTETDFFAKTYQAFNFPSATWPNWDGFDDWICDPDFYKGEKFALIIYDASLLLSADKAAKETWFYYLFVSILPFWENDVERVVVCNGLPGKKMPYDVYFVD